jgi:hypothetical protein
MPLPRSQADSRLDPTPYSRLQGPDLPARVEVLLLREWHPAVAHATRTTRGGDQVLVTIGRRLIWVPCNRIRSELGRPARGAASF